MATTVPEFARTHPWAEVNDPFMDVAVPVRFIVTAPCVLSAGILMVAPLGVVVPVAGKSTALLVQGAFW